MDLLQSRIWVSFNPIITEKLYWPNVECRVKFDTFKLENKPVKNQALPALGLNKDINSQQKTKYNHQEPLLGTRRP